MPASSLCDRGLKLPTAILQSSLNAREIRGPHSCPWSSRLHRERDWSIALSTCRVQRVLLDQNFLGYSYPFRRQFSHLPSLNPIMPLGVLESSSTHGHHVPGTVLLDTQANTAELELSGLKKGTGKNKEVILVPQPSNSPNDPLNWPLWQRDLILLVYCYATVCVIGG